MKLATQPEPPTENSVKKPNGLILMSSGERDLYLPDDLVCRLRESLGKLEVIDQYDRRDFDWPSLLKTHDAEILFSSWSTPCLPADLCLDEVPLKYVCHLPGGLRNITPRPLLERGLLVTNWGNSISRTVAECGLILILNCLRRVGHRHEVMHRKPDWGRTLEGQTSLFGRTVGLH